MTYGTPNMAKSITCTRRKSAKYESRLGRSVNQTKRKNAPWLAARTNCSGADMAVVMVRDSWI